MSDKERELQEEKAEKKAREKAEKEAKKKAEAEAQKRLDQEKYRTAMDYVLMSRYRNPNAQVFSSSLFSHISAGMYTSQPLAFIAPNPFTVKAHIMKAIIEQNTPRNKKLLHTSNCRYTSSGVCSGMAIRKGMAVTIP